MIKVFIFEDKVNSSYDPLAYPSIFRIDINKEIEELEKDNWSIVSVQHQIIVDYYEYHTRFDKNVFTIVANHN